MIVRRLASAIVALAALNAGEALADCDGDAPPCTVASGAYHAVLPADAPTRGAVLFLHGYGATGAGVARNKGLMKALTGRGYAVIAPQGEPIGAGRKGGRWNAFASDARRDDVAFLSAVADDAAARFGLDRSAMVLAGFSGGGMMAWRVACDTPRAFAAYAPVAGLMWRPLPEACAGPVRLHHTHGWSDPVVPIEGRSVAGGRITQGDLFKGLDLMRRANGCARDDPDEYGATGKYLIRRWTDCAAGSALEMALHPGGHRTPMGWSALALDWFEGLAPYSKVSE